ncbi:MAG: methionine--tRNA ligase, partial [Candidatus Niyogibacteria bacterium]|nr:methionine--tRNA ligase [Candidatus Niyogibacteria bacterium]
MEKKFYITTAIDYANAAPHMGHALEKTQADALARYHRILGEEVRFTTGTDEHGAKIARAAKKAETAPQAFVDQNAEKFKELLRLLDISNDDFIRTSDAGRHHPAAVKIWRALAASGDIYKKSYRGLYCVGHEAFITEKDLTDGKCADHNAAPETIEEENYFFKLSKYGPRIKQAIESGEMKIIPEFRQNEILALIAEGLEDVSFSRPARDISWGVPVPDDPTQTMYVWCDALTNYISALGFGGADEKLFEKFWPEATHLIGKDILRFHAAIWPGMLLSAGLPLPKRIITHGFVTSQGQKMSKTIGNVVDPLTIIEKYGAEALRYYFVREMPTFDDGDFTEEKMKAAYNGSLANGLGNFVSRTSKMITQYFDGTLARPGEEALSNVPLQSNLHLKLSGAPAGGEKLELFSLDYVLNREVLPEYHKAMAEYNLARATEIIWKFL